MAPKTIRTASAMDRVYNVFIRRLRCIRASNDAISIFTNWLHCIRMKVVFFLSGRERMFQNKHQTKIDELNVIKISNDSKFLLWSMVCGRRSQCSLLLVHTDLLWVWTYGSYSRLNTTSGSLNEFYFLQYFFQKL